MFGNIALNVFHDLKPSLDFHKLYMYNYMCVYTHTHTHMSNIYIRIHTLGMPIVPGLLLF